MADTSKKFRAPRDRRTQEERDLEFRLDRAVIRGDQQLEAELRELLVTERGKRVRR